MTVMSHAPFVVAVSGTSGAGKSAVVEGIASALALSGRHAVALHFDDYADVSQLPEDLVDWMERGANPDEWRTDRLVTALVTRIDGAEPDTVILVEEPFGRARTPMRSLSDLAIHIDLPLGISLARRLLRDFVPESGELDEPGTVKLRDYLAQYLRGGGAAYQAIDQMARETSDVILDGLLDPAELVDRARREMERLSKSGERHS
jgi:uridine kinase